MTDNSKIIELIEVMSEDVVCSVTDKDGKTFFVYYKDILEIINRQKAEIERLKLITTSNPYCVSIGTADIFTANHEEYEWLLAKISAEAIKEFAERLKGEAYTNNYCEKIVLEADIDNLVKEMVGDTK